MVLLLILFLFFIAPSIAYADLDTFLRHVDSMIINPAIKLLFAVAIAYFLWGMFEFILNLSNQEKKTNGKSHMLWGVVGLAIMMGVWGILNIVLNTLGISRDQINPQEGTVHLDPYNPSVRPFQE